MRVEHLQYLMCPRCRSPLSVVEGRPTADGRLEQGELACAGCAKRYPVVRWIPRFVAADNYASGFGFQWLKHARTQYDAETGTRISETRFFEETRSPRRMEGERLLEAGSGSGRFTEHAASTGAMVVSFDYSVAVEANYASNGHRPNVLIVQADIYEMPFARGAFDRVVCIGVLQHTPDVERSFRALVEMLKPGGRITVDYYRKPEGLRWLTNSKYLLRPLTRRIPPQRLYPIVRGYVSALWPLARLLRRIPYLGIRLNWALMLYDYSRQLPLAEDKLREWSILDAFDALSPRYDSPQDLATAERWMREAALDEVEVHLGYNGIEARARRPAARAG